jgi:hypothetical protein
LRRLVLLSALLILVGLALLLPSSALYSIITTGSTTSGLLSSLGSTDDSSTIESILGFGLIAVGLVLEVFSLFTDFGTAMPAGTAPMAEETLTTPSVTTARAESAPLSSTGWAVASTPEGAKEEKQQP